MWYGILFQMLAFEQKKGPKLISMQVSVSQMYFSIFHFDLMKFNWFKWYPCLMNIDEIKKKNV